MNGPNIVNSSNVVNCPMVVNCPYKWAECSKLSNCCKWSKCCDKEKKQTNTQKNTTLSEQFQNQLLVFWYFTGLVQVLQCKWAKCSKFHLKIHNASNNPLISILYTPIIKTNPVKLIRSIFCYFYLQYILIRPKKKICVFTVTRPTLIFASDPMHFYTEFG